MANEVRLEGLRGNTPVGFLACMGLLSLLGGRLGWDEGGVAQYEPGAESGDLVEALVLRLRGCSVEYKEFPSHPKGMKREDWVSLLKKRPEWAQALGGESRDGLRPTALCLGAGQLKMVKDALKSAALLDINVAEENAARGRIAEALFGPWQYADEVHSLCIDPEAKRDGAFTRTEPSNTKTRGVAGAYWLAFQGLVAVPVIAGQTVGATKFAWRWVTGSQRRGLAGWRALMMLVGAMRDAERVAQNITVWESRIGRSGSNGWLLQSRQVRER